MICYKDKTFCISSNTRCQNTKCYRFLSDDEREKARIWWGSDEAPIAFADFWDKCLEREAVDETKV
jgi:hypothetical protein